MSAATRSRNVTAALLGLWLLVLSVVGAGDLGGRQSRGSVSVLATWTGEEGRPFEEMLKTFSRTHRIHVDYEGTTALREVLSSQVDTGTPPDIAVLPSSGELAAYAQAGHLTRLDEVIPADHVAAYGDLWKPGLRVNRTIVPYGIAIKADLKSIVWYDKHRRPKKLPALAADGGQWCVGMGGDATSGWPGTDWIEDLLLQQLGKDDYEDWATDDLGDDDRTLPWDDDRMVHVWESWGDLFDARTAKKALVTDFRAAGKKLFAPDPPCALEHQGSFIRADYDPPSRADFASSAGLLPDTTPQPPDDEVSEPPVHEVSGDFAVMFNGTPQAQELMSYLVSAEAQQIWAENTDRDDPDRPRPFFANREVPLKVWSKDKVAGRIARTLRDSGSLCLDASDAMPPRMRLAFQRAALEYLSDTRQNPERLLRSLERVRKDISADARKRIRGAPGQPWPSAVCG